MSPDPAAAPRHELRRSVNARPCVLAAAADGGANGNSSGPVTRSALPQVGPVKYDHVMLAILDANPYLNDGSRGAAATAAALAGTGSGKMTILLVDEEDMGEKAATRMDMLTTSLREAGVHEFEVLDQVAPSSAAAACGDVADARGADLLVVSFDAVHSKALDANLLAEFVNCPIMLLP